MPRRTLLASLCIVAAVSCGPGDAAIDEHGTLIVEREGARIFSGPATASRCPLDSTIAVAVTGTGWSAAFAVRAAWPADSARTIPIGQILGPGTAVLAARPLADSAGEALISARGTLKLDTGALLLGHAEATAPTAIGAPDSVRLSARFSGIPVRDDLCSPPVTP